ncbi:MAG: TIM barrel protein [Phycisphaerae bacterium]|nr:TIM barrel protein [Phycisphaerae bacterium]
MAAVGNCRTVQARVAHQIGQAFADKDVAVAAIATFLPEIISLGRTGRKARRALEFLIGLAKELQDLGHPTRTVEIVGGSLIGGVWPGRLRRDGGMARGIRSLLKAKGRREVYAATVMSKEHALRRLLDSLLCVVDLARSRNVQFALELEPGPLFAVGDQEAIDLICKLLASNRYAALSSCLGLNLDVAHWQLANIDVPQVGVEAKMRVVHAHISDHGRGHFGDVPICHINNEEHFARWLGVVAEAIDVPRNDQQPKWYGALSVELEACRLSEHLRESVAVLQRIRNRHDP